MRLGISSQNINNADTSKLEKECDRLVYKLYQLTYDEVKIIDPEFELTVDHQIILMSSFTQRSLGVAFHP